MLDIENGAIFQQKNKYLNNKKMSHFRLILQTDIEILRNLINHVLTG